jgi:CubicO group peptidase (beta-lactamase class C family)
MVTFEPLLGAVQTLIDAGRIPGVVLRVCRGGEVEVEAALGVATPKDGRAMQCDTIFRIYSMTKPITTVAAMMLIEGGQIKLDEPIARIFPEFEDLKVGVETAAGADGLPTLKTEALQRLATVRDLMRHTAGFTYGTFGDSLVKKCYRAAGVDRRDQSSSAFIEVLASMPLAYQPATTWEYSRATDVLGIMVERISGMSLDDYFSERIFAPLGMVDSGFSVAPGKLARLAEPFDVDPDLGTPIVLSKPSGSSGYFSGGGGLFSTLDDYQRFIDLMRGRGSVGGVRLLSSASVDLMTRDHLGPMSRGSDYLPGSDSGFGLGFAVRIRDSELGHRGDYFWSGVGGTHFWVDPSMDLSAIWLMQAPNQREETTELFCRLVTQSYRG